MRILVRLPNWLGDMVMSVAFIKQLQQQYPDAQISVIAKKGIHDLLQFFPAFEHQFVYDKARYGGVRGVWRFGRHIKATAAFDLYFSLPESLSSAIMGYATGAGKRIGYRNEGRSVLLTHTYAKPAVTHRVQEYLALLGCFSGKASTAVEVRLRHTFQTNNFVAVNINSEAPSRRLTVAKAVELLVQLRATITEEIKLIGAPKEADFVGFSESLVLIVPDFTLARSFKKCRES